jgi:hypothetical protein
MEALLHKDDVARRKQLDVRYILSSAGACQSGNPHHCNPRGYWDREPRRS